MSKKLIAGYESYMEDDVEVTVDTGDAGEVAESISEAADTNIEVTDTTNESAEDAVDAEMIFKRYDELDRMKAHLEKYGASREFMAWHNHDGALAEGLGITIPATESLDATGDPYSRLSIACMEGISDALKSIWEFIKKVCAKIARFFGRITEALVRAFSSLDSNIGRLRKALKEREPDTERLDKYEGSFVKPKALEDDLKAIYDAKNAPRATLGTQGVKNIEYTVKMLVNGINNGRFTYKDSNFFKDISKSLDDLDEDMRKHKDAYKIANSKPSRSTQKFESSYKPKDSLDAAADIKKEMDTRKATNSIIQTITKQMVDIATKMERRDDPGADEAARAARRLSSIINRTTAIMNRFDSELLWIANQHVRTASLYITNCMKKV